MAGAAHPLGVSLIPPHEYPLDYPWSDLPAPDIPDVDMHGYPDKVFTRHFKIARASLLIINKLKLTSDVLYWVL